MSKRKMFLFLIIDSAFLPRVWARTLHDVRPPVNYPMSIWIIILSILAVILLCAAAYFYLKKRLKNVSADLPVQKPRAPWETALERLARLNEKKLLEKGLVNDYYTEVSEIVRYYCEDRFFLKAPDMTTEEFLRDLRTSSQLNENQKKRLKDFLTQCDLVKFAKHKPSPSEAGEVFISAKDFILETKIAETVKGGSDGL